MYAVDIHYANRNETSKTVEAASLSQALEVVRMELEWTLVAHRDEGRWPPKPYPEQPAGWSIAARLTLRNEQLLLGFAYNKTSRRWEINATGLEG